VTWHIWPTRMVDDLRAAGVHLSDVVEAGPDTYYVYLPHRLVLTVYTAPEYRVLVTGWDYGRDGWYASVADAVQLTRGW
jgi:hypothetical protein